MKGLHLKLPNWTVNSWYSQIEISIWDVYILYLSLPKLRFGINVKLFRQWIQLEEDLILSFAAAGLVFSNVEYIMKLVVWVPIQSKQYDNIYVPTYIRHIMIEDHCSIRNHNYWANKNCDPKQILVYGRANVRFWALSSS